MIKTECTCTTVFYEKFLFTYFLQVVRNIITVGDLVGGQTVESGARRALGCLTVIASLGLLVTTSMECNSGYNRARDGFLHYVGR